MKKKKMYLSAFLIPITIMLVLFMIRGIFPFGYRSFLFADMYHQYLPFFSELFHKVRAGESLNFSFNVGIGSNFLALFVYYLASPFNIFSFLVPEDFLVEFMSYLIVLKIGLAGLTFCIYLHEHFQISMQNGGEAEVAGSFSVAGGRLACVLFSCFYALSGFMAAYNYNIMWLDCVALFPLIVLGLERLVEEGRCRLYCVTLALSIFTNYYISIMICIFLVLYFLVLLVLASKRMRSIMYFVFFSLLAGGMASVLLVPEVCAILNTDFGDMDFPKTIESYFSVLDVLARHCMCVYTERGLAHWPNIYCGSAVLLLIPMYLMNQKISIREKFCRMVLAGFMLFSFSTNILDFIWHGLNYPDSLPARQSFIYIFLVLVMCYDAWYHVRDMKEEVVYYGYLCAVGFFLFCEKFVDHEDFELGVKLLTLVFVTVHAVLLHLYRTREDRKIRKAVAIMAVAAVIVECGVNTFVTSVATVSRSAHLGQQYDYKALYEMTKEREDGFYRLEKFTRKTMNDGTFTGYPTASVFSSTMNSQVMDLYKRLGMRYSKVYYDFDGATVLTSAMLNVNYMFGESDKYENELYMLVGQSGDIFLYQCNAALPFGYVAPVGFDLDLDEEKKGFDLQNQMIEDMGIQGKLFRKMYSEEAHNDVKFTAVEGGFYYAVLTAPGISKVDYIGGKTEEESFKDLKKGSILYLGYLEQDQTVILANRDDADILPKIAADVYRMDTEILEQVLEALSVQHMEDVEWESDRITASLTLEQPGRVICSVPYEDGWTVRINGEEVEGVLFGGCLMAFDLEAGEYAFEMKYVPVGAWAGTVVSVGSVLLFIFVMCREKMRGIKIGKH